MNSYVKRSKFSKFSKFAAEVVIFWGMPGTSAHRRSAQGA